MNTTMTTLLALAVTACARLAEPAFFTEKPYAEAKQAAADNDKLLFVKATAVWCGPCKMMDRTTFTDQRVIDWLTENAVSVSVDVDEEPQLAGRLRIRAMPTTILMRGDEEAAPRGGLPRRGRSARVARRGPGRQDRPAGRAAPPTGGGHPRTDGPGAGPVPRR